MIEVVVPNYDELNIEQLDFDAPAQINRSAWTGGRKVVGLPGAALWRGKVSVDGLTTEMEERPWRAFLAKLNGVQNWFRAALPCQTHIGGVPTVAGGATAGRTLPLSGMSPSTIILSAGQHITVPLPIGLARAVRLTDDLVTDASGNAIAQFSPALNQVPAFGTAIETANPYVPVTSSDTRLSIITTDSVSSFSFDIEEAR